MTEQERIETLLTALDAALDIAALYEKAVWGDGITGRQLQQAQDDLAHLCEYAKHEREKQGTMTMSNEVIEEKESVGE